MYYQLELLVLEPWYRTMKQPQGDNFSRRGRRLPSRAFARTKGLPRDTQDSSKEIIELEGIKFPVCLVCKDIYGLKCSNYDWDCFAKCAFRKYGRCETLDSEGTMYKLDRHLLSLYVYGLLISGPDNRWVRTILQNMRADITMKEGPDTLKTYLASHLSEPHQGEDFATQLLFSLREFTAPVYPDQARELGVAP